jgi:hypothetical protein
VRVRKEVEDYFCGFRVFRLAARRRRRRRRRRVWPTTTSSPAPVSAAPARIFLLLRAFVRRLDSNEEKEGEEEEVEEKGGTAGVLFTRWFTCMGALPLTTDKKFRGVAGWGRGGFFAFFLSLNIVMVQIASKSERWTERECDGQRE